MKILLTGPTGFVGRHLIDELLAGGSLLRVLVRPQSAGKITAREGLEVVIGDLVTGEGLTDALRDIHTVIHLAARTSPASDSLISATNVRGTAHLIDASRRAEVKRFLFVSTASVLSAHLGAYEKSKLEAEELVRSSTISFLILRPSLIYGAGDTKNIGMLIRAIKTFPYIPVVGDGTSIMQPLYVDDLTALIRELCQLPVWPRRAYTLAGRERISLDECCDKLCNYMGLKKSKVHLPFYPVYYICSFLYRLGLARIAPIQLLHLKEGFACDIRSAIDDLGFRPCSFDEGLGRMFCSGREGVSQ
ncbi:MAG: NAD-dependent epimerase/dehydratase family protein [Candidatus Omnitrophica bacterium]|nr:NAD-dependent epimerase/dehydratase family protein [Candidatus Omnitrophota bacterium]